MAISAYGYSWEKRRFGGIFTQELEGFKGREGYTIDQWHEYTMLQLRKLLVHAFNSTPHYNETFTRAGFTQSALQNFQLIDILKLPFLEKNELRACGKTTLLSTQLEKGGEFFASSGSTGTPTQILFSYPMHQRWSAGFEARIRHWAGVDRFTSRGMIGGRRVVPQGIANPPFYRYNFFEKQTYFSAYHISADNTANYVRGMRRHHCEYMTGYAMSNYFLARFIKELQMEAPQMKAVITSSEKLTVEMREIFKQVYHCNSFDSWSGLEACGLVSECEYGSLHVSPDLGIIELLDENGNEVKPGEVGEVVCTGLVNFDQPLIRYRIGDLMRRGTDDCKCGRQMPVISEIIGRVEDTVVGMDGREMVRFHGIFIDLPNLIEGQVIQWELGRFEIKIVSNGRFSTGESEMIRQRMISQLGDIKIEIHEVESIPRNANGKFKSVISHVQRATHQGSHA